VSLCSLLKKDNKSNEQHEQTRTRKLNKGRLAVIPKNCYCEALSVMKWS